MPLQGKRDPHIASLKGIYLISHITEPFAAFAQANLHRAGATEAIHLVYLDRNCPAVDPGGG